MTWQNKLLYCIVSVLLLSACRTYKEVTDERADTLQLNRWYALNMWRANQVDVADTITYYFLPSTSSMNDTAAPVLQKVRHMTLYQRDTLQQADTTKVTKTQFFQSHKKREHTTQPKTSVSLGQLLVIVIFLWLLVITVVCFLKVKRDRV